jgi:hypothetical protein
MVSVPYPSSQCQQNGIRWVVVVVVTVFVAEVTEDKERYPHEEDRGDEEMVKQQEGSQT